MKTHCRQAAWCAGHSRDSQLNATCRQQLSIQQGCFHAEQPCEHRFCIFHWWQEMTWELVPWPLCWPAPLNSVSRYDGGAANKHFNHTCWPCFPSALAWSFSRLYDPKALRSVNKATSHRSGQLVLLPFAEAVQNCRMSPSALMYVIQQVFALCTGIDHLYHVRDFSVFSMHIE